MGWNLRNLAAALAVLAVLGAAPAGARTTGRALAYPRDQVWPTAVRFLAVDEHAKLLDKDADAGYVLFELSEGGKPLRGSLELTIVPGDAAGVRFVISLVDRPDWAELAMLTRLEAKLRAELGAPNSKPKPQEPAKDPDPPKDPPNKDKP